jgi:hypothetical protein
MRSAKSLGERARGELGVMQVAEVKCYILENQKSAAPLHYFIRET